MRSFYQYRGFLYIYFKMTNFSTLNRVNGPISISKHPFILPNINDKHNFNRFSQISKILRLYLQLFIDPLQLGVGRPIAGLFAYLDFAFNVSVNNYCILSAKLANWFKVWYLSGESSQGDIEPTIWDSRSGCPSPLAEIIKAMKLIESEKHRNMVFRFVLSILEMYKVTKVPVSVSLNSITNKFDGTDPELATMNIQSVFESLNLDVESIRSDFRRNCSEHKFHISTSAGPNGHALWSAHIDAQAIMNDTELRLNLEKLAELMDLEEITDKVVTSSNVYVHLSPEESDKTKHSKLHALYEKGVKNRVIGIGDYFTQDLLCPIHDLISSINRSFTTDGTFNQLAQVNRIKDMSLHKDSELYSFDLSSATDRLPIKLQVKLLSALLGNRELAELWSKVLVDRDFVTENGHNVRYEVGQPMGFKSSFPMLAFTHHCIVQEAARLAGLHNFKDYALLGDDIVINGANVANNYRGLMASLGVKISPHKSILPNVEEKVGAEFAKRLILNGSDVSPIPVHLVCETIQNPSLAPQLQTELQSRNIFTDHTMYEFFAMFLKESDLQYLFLLNGVPSKVSGISNPIPYPGAIEADCSNWPKLFNVTPTDLENFFTYHLITEQLSRTDAVLKKAMTWMGILLEESKLTDGSPIFGGFRGTTTLALAIQEKLSKSDSSTRFHPVQDAAFNLGTQIVKVLELFSTNEMSAKDLLLSDSLYALRISLTGKADHTPEAYRLFADRRLLEKSIGSLMSASSQTSPGDKKLAFTGKIEGVSSLFTIVTEIGRTVTVTPHVPKVINFTSSVNSRLGTASTGFQLGSFVPLKRK